MNAATGPGGRRRAVVSGGSGFLGSHLCERLLAQDWEVVAVDNFSTGHRRNIAHLLGDTRFELVTADICEPLDLPGPIDLVLNFASPASPPRYSQLAIETLNVGALGTERLLQLASARGARFVHASTSEVYGDPAVHPQVETYWGHVNPIGPRSMYDEAKRFAEAMIMAYHRTKGVDVGIVRIFNTYGPRLDASDGRVVSNLLTQAMAGQPLTVYGDGLQTRSFCYVDDEVDGILRLAESDLVGPVNIGNPTEHTMLELAQAVLKVTNSGSGVEHRDLPTDDPTRRCPDISLARRELGWQPRIGLEEGLLRTARWFRDNESIQRPAPLVGS
jgi:dTDP-glucose 4,6-dehydratase